MTGHVVTVVAVHGNGGGAFRFSLLPDELAPGVRLHAVTLPGFEGEPLPAGPLSMTTYTDALAKELAAIAGPRVVLGHGIGGSIALDALGRHPEVAEALILHAPVGARLDERWFPRLMTTKPMRRLVQLGISSLPVRVVAGRLLFRSAPAGFTNRFLAEYRRAESFGPMFDLLTAEWFDSLRPLELPAVGLWGQKDRVLGPDQLAFVERLVPASTRRIEAEWGHFPMIDVPEEYGRVVGELALELTGR